MSSSIRRSTAWRMGTVEERRAYDREWYASHPEYRKRQKELKAARREQIARWVKAWKAVQGCCVCGDHDPVVLDFHHRDGADKKFELGRGSFAGRSAKAVAAEIAKCDVLCANCHRRRHADGV